MATENTVTSLMQCRLKEISEISDFLNESDRVIKNLSERLQWDTKHLREVSNCSYSPWSIKVDMITWI